MSQRPPLSQRVEWARLLVATARSEGSAQAIAAALEFTAADSAAAAVAEVHQEIETMARESQKHAKELEECVLQEQCQNAPVIETIETVAADALERVASGALDAVERSIYVSARACLQYAWF